MAVIPRIPVVPPVTHVEDGLSDKGVSLSQVLLRLQGVIQTALPESIWIRAEIAKADIHGGHIYLDLSERADD